MIYPHRGAMFPGPQGQGVRVGHLAFSHRSCPGPDADEVAVLAVGVDHVWTQGRRLDVRSQYIAALVANDAVVDQKGRVHGPRC